MAATGPVTRSRELPSAAYAKCEVDGCRRAFSVGALAFTSNLLQACRFREQEGILGGLHDWMARENATIMAVLCLVIGAKLIGDAITARA